MGDPNAVYPIMYWVLKRMPENHKRVYLAKYLMPVSIPQDMIASDDGVREVYDHYKIMVNQFKEVHKNVDRLGGFSKADSTKSSYDSLDKEKEQLQARVDATRKKLLALNNNDAFFKATQAMRQEIEVERDQDDRMSEQLAMRKTFEQRTMQASKKLQDIKMDFQDMNIDKMIKALRDEVAMNKVLNEDKLPAQINELREKVNIVLGHLGDHLDPDLLNKQVYTLEKEIQVLSAGNQGKCRDADGHWDWVTPSPVKPLGDLQSPTHQRWGCGAAVLAG